MLTFERERSKVVHRLSQDTRRSACCSWATLPLNVVKHCSTALQSHSFAQSTSNGHKVENREIGRTILFGRTHQPPPVSIPLSNNLEE